MWYKSHLSEVALKMGAAICLLKVIFKKPVIGPSLGSLEGV